VKRKAFFWLVPTFLLTTVSLTEGQHPKVYRVGILGPPGALERRVQIKGLRSGLRESGYVEGKNIQLDIPNVKTYDELRPIAERYVEKKAEIIVTHGGTATAIANEATKEIPIVFIWGIADPVQSGFIKSVARPGTNITGLSSFAGPEIFGKRLELFKELVPTLKRLVLLYNARGENPSHEVSLVVLREVAPKLRLKLAEEPIRSADEAVDRLASVSKETTDGIFIIGSGLFLEPCKKNRCHCNAEETSLMGLWTRARPLIVRARRISRWPTGGLVCGSNSQRSQATRLGRRGADKVRACDQPESSQADWPDDSTECAGKGGQNNQIIEESEVALLRLN
jgi:putative ABC transport system substrate-binding protein